MAKHVDDTGPCRLRPVEHWSVDKLTLSAGNPRNHPPEQPAQFIAAYKAYDYFSPIVVNERGGVICGELRLTAAKAMGMSVVPVIVIDGLTPMQERMLRVADNKIAANAGWDEKLLRIELRAIIEHKVDIDYAVIGFTTPEIDKALDAEPTPEEADALDDIQGLDGKAVVIRRGDMVLMGDQVLYCGDSRKLLSFHRVMGSGRELARMVFSDPPYNLKVADIGGLGAIKHAEFVSGSGEMSSPQYVDFLGNVFDLSVEFSEDGALHFQCIDWRHFGEMIEAGERWYSELKNVCTWVKPVAGMGSLYRSQTESIFVWKAGTAPHVNNIQLGVHGRNRSNYWPYRGAIKTGAASELAMHPTVKPVAMIMDAIKDASNVGEIVLDPFGGSGSTLIAAEKTGRRARLIEYEGRYCDVAIRRWENLTGRDAILAKTGETYRAVAARRLLETQIDREAA